MESSGDLESLVDSWPAEHVSVSVFSADSAFWSTGDHHRRYELASLTKLLVSVAVWVAVEEGALSLDEPAGPAGSTVRHLLAHASGLPFEGNEAIAAPGTRRIYSNSGFETLARHLESSTSLSWQDYVSAAVLEPLGMTATALGHSAARSATSTVDDLQRWCRELLHPTLVTQGTVADGSSNQFGDLDGVVPGFGQQRPCPWGLGVEIKGAKSPHWTGAACSARTFGHFGAAGTFCWVDPLRSIAAVALGDAGFGPWAVDLWPQLSDALIDRSLDLALDLTLDGKG